MLVRSSSPVLGGAPNEGWIKINFDAHIGDDLRRSLGVVAHDCTGKVLFTGTRRCTASWDVKIAELATTCFNLELARRFEVDKEHLERDSLSVMDAIAKREEGRAPIDTLYDYAFDMCSCFNNSIYSFVHRGGNIVAHIIDRWKMTFAQEKIFMNPFLLASRLW